MTDLFRDVDEALQRDRMAGLWRKYGPVLVVAVILLIVATGAVTAYRAWTDGAKRDETARLVAAAEDDAAAAKLEQLAGSADGAYKTVALMNAAGREAEAKNFTKAADLYRQVADDKNAPADLKDLAAIYHVRSAQLGEDEAKLDYKSLAARLDPIAANDSSPFRYQAKLDAATLYGSALADPQKALDLLKGFDAENIPGSLKEKADALSRVYAYDLTRQSPTTASQPGIAKE